MVYTYIYNFSTKTLVPSSGITIVSNGFHAHTRGRWLKTEIIRDGKELSELGSIKHFDFYFQNADQLPAGGRQIFPGDRIITTCGYDTKNEVANVYGGLGTDSEMYHFNLIIKVF
jgi:hypothetical protein